jgi:tetratricopeptide (TPR) repeat protein
MKGSQHSLMARLHKKLQSDEKSRVFARLADELRHSGHVEEAIELCRKGLQFHPDYASGHVVLGKCYQDRGDLEEARGAFREALTLDSGNVLVLKNLGDITFRQGDLEAAAEHYQRILELDAGNAEVREVLEELKTAQDEHPQADPPKELSAVTEVPVFGEQLSEPPDGVSRPAVEEPSADFEGEEPKLSPEETELLRDEEDEESGKGLPRGMATVTLAEVYFQQGLLDQAIETYQKVLRHQPDDEAVKDRLAELKTLRSTNLKKKKVSGEESPEGQKPIDDQKAEEPGPTPPSETTGET